MTNLLCFDPSTIGFFQKSVYIRFTILLSTTGNNFGTRLIVSHARTVLKKSQKPFDL